MAMRKGNFFLFCDDPGCDESVDLETGDFQEAIDNRGDLTDGWTKYGGYGNIKDYCPDHDPNYGR